MKKSIKVLSSLLAISLIINTFAVKSYADAEPAITETIETDQVIVQLKEGMASDLENANLLTIEENGADQLMALKVPEDETVDSYMNELEDRDEVESVEPDHLLKSSFVSNDPYISSRQYHLQKIGADKAWDKTLGSPEVIVAVLDDGFDLNHTDLSGQIVSPYNAVIGNDGNLSIDDHGTHVAGIIGSSINNHQLGAGVAPNTSIMPIDVFDGEYAYTSHVIEGIYHAVDAGADIINMSLGGYYSNSSFNDAIQYAHQNGLVIVAAAGNDSTVETHYPSSYENVISVGSTTSYDSLSPFSNYGKDIDIVAPGSGIYSTLSYNSFGSMSGTSMAAPIVAGVAALIKASEPALSNEEIANRLYSSSKDLGIAGKDPIYGSGRVNAKEALLIKDIPAPDVFDLFDHSTNVKGYIPYEIKDATVTISSAAGEVLASEEGFSGFAYFDLPILQQPADAILYVSVSDDRGNTSEAKEITVKAGDYKETNTSRLGHLKSTSVRIYKEYKERTDFVEAGSGNVNEVYYIKKQAEYGDKLYYLISRNPSSTSGVVGWVEASGLSVHTHKGVDKKAKIYYLKGTGSAYAKAWGGSKNSVYQNLSAMKNQQFKVHLTEKVGNNIWYRGELNGKTVWIHSGFVSSLSETKTSKLGHIRNTGVKIYPELGKETAAFTAGEKLTDAVYYIKKEAVLNSQKYYLLSNNPSNTSGVVGWTKASDLSTHTHQGVDMKTKTYYLKGTGSAYTKAWGGSKDTVHSKLSAFKNQPFKIHLTESVGGNVWYRGELNGKTVWLHSSFVAPLKESKTSKLGHIRNSGVKIYRELGKESTSFTAGSKWTNAVYYIKKEAVLNGQRYNLLSNNASSTAGLVGWVKAGDLSSNSHAGVDKKAKTYYLNGKGSAFTKAWGGSKDLVFENLATYKNEKFEIHLTEKVGNNSWYRGKLKGKTVWVHHSFVNQSSPSGAGKYPAPSVKTPGHYVDGVLIVNKKYSLPSNYNPGVNGTAQRGANAMLAAAKAKGIKISPISAYRSYSYQKNLYNNYVRNYGQARADRFSAKPGHSEHQTGLAYDFGGSNQAHWLEESFAQTAEGKWLYANAHKYGFILRYPKGKESITGYMYEPWHYRYVGSDQAAKIKNSGKTIEEYFKVSGK